MCSKGWTDAWQVRAVAREEPGESKWVRLEGWVGLGLRLYQSPNLIVFVGGAWGRG